MRSHRQTDAALARAGAHEFLPSFARLQTAIDRACAQQTRWEEKVAAGIQAALAFAGRSPELARALTVQSHGEELRGGDRQDEVVAFFARMLKETTPAEKLYPTSTEESLVESIATVIRGHLESGTTAELPRLAPDLVYLTLLPYVSNADARHWSESLPTGD